MNLSGTQIELEHFAVAAPFDRGPQHPFGGRAVQALLEQIEERLLRQFARGRLLQAVADVRCERHVRQQLLAQQLLAQRVRTGDVVAPQLGQVQVGIRQLRETQQRQRLRQRQQVVVGELGLFGQLRQVGTAFAAVFPSA